MRGRLEQAKLDGMKNLIQSIEEEVKMRRTFLSDIDTEKRLRTTIELFNEKYNGIIEEISRKKVSQAKLK